MDSSLLFAVQFLLALQATGATVVGTVRDRATGEPLPGAVVALTDLDRITTTDAWGRYELRAVPSGPQHLTARSIGYTERTLHALVPRDGVLEINVSLHPEPIAIEALEVRPRIPVRGVDPADDIVYPDRGLSIAAVRNHPLLAEPDALQALGGGGVVLSPESPRGVHVRGGASDQIAYLLDGIPVFSPYHTAGLFSAWNPDALSRIHLSSSSPSPAQPEALSGTITAVTRAPGSRLRAQGSVSTTQMRLTVDGPVGLGGAGYLVSLRSGFPGLIGGRQEASYLSGESGDWLAKIEVPALSGRLRLLGYDSGNEIDAVAAAEAEEVPDPGRNVFDWHSRSLGAEWAGSLSGVSIRFRGWRATADAEAAWIEETGAAELGASRRDHGLVAAVELGDTTSTTTAGIRAEWSSTTYRVGSEPGAATDGILRARTPLTAAFIQHDRAMGRRTRIELGASLIAAAGELHLGPRARLIWEPWKRLVFSGSYARTLQYAQSLRNPESVVGGIFPADLYIGAAAPDVPVARSDLGVISAEYRPLPGLRLGVEAYERDLAGLVLVAPRAGEPFASLGTVGGSGAARGLAFDAAVSTARYGIVASYGLQRVRLEYRDSSYVPDHGSTQLIDAGVIVFPTASSSVRVGITGALGRRTTPLTTPFEWESCNLLDRGCEFAGSPEADVDRLGATKLPAYLRLDLGLRKHWHLRAGGRDVVLALFGTVANLLGRKNVLTHAIDPSTGERVEIEMRPLAPLLVGLDWRF